MVFDVCYAKLRDHNTSLGVSKNYKSILNELEGRYVFTLLIIPILTEIILQIALCPPPSPSPFFPLLLFLLLLLLFLLFILILHQFPLHNFLSLSLSLSLSLHFSFSHALRSSYIKTGKLMWKELVLSPAYIFFQTKIKEKLFSYSHMPMVSCSMAPAFGSDRKNDIIWICMVRIQVII